MALLRPGVANYDVFGCRPSLKIHAGGGKEFPRFQRIFVAFWQERGCLWNKTMKKRWDFYVFKKNTKKNCDFS